MVRTQIQLSDEIYARIKELCRRREWSLAEAMRRAAEQLIETHPLGPEDAPEWELPAARRMGKFLAEVDDWRELAN